MLSCLQAKNDYNTYVYDPVMILRSNYIYIYIRTHITLAQRGSQSINKTRAWSSGCGFHLARADLARFPRVPSMVAASIGVCNY